MTQYIDKAAVVAEIERLQDTTMDEYHNFETSYKEGMFDGLSLIENYIDTLEVKEVDLEVETKKWWQNHLHLNPDNKLWMDAHQSVVFAKHFFELGLNARKEEDKCV